MYCSIRVLLARSPRLSLRFQPHSSPAPRVNRTPCERPHRRVARGERLNQYPRWIPYVGCSQPTLGPIPRRRSPPRDSFPEGFPLRCLRRRRAARRRSRGRMGASMTSHRERRLDWGNLPSTQGRNGRGRGRRVMERRERLDERRTRTRQGRNARDTRRARTW